MNTKKIVSGLIIVLIMVAALVGATLYFTVGDGGRLNTPKELTHIAGVLTWSDVVGAKQYEVIEGDNLPVTVPSSSYVLTKKGEFKVTVKAQSGKAYPKDSKAAEITIFNQDTYLPLMGSFSDNTAVDTKNFAKSTAKMKFYYKTTSSAGISIDIPTVAGQNIVDATAIGLSSSDFSINGKALVINKGYLAQFPDGAEIIVGVKLSDESVYNFILAFVKTDMPMTTLDNYTFQTDLKNGTTGITVNFNGKVTTSVVVKSGIGTTRLERRALSINGAVIPQSITSANGTSEVLWDMVVDTKANTTALTLTSALINRLGVGSGLFCLQVAEGDIFFMGAITNTTNAIYNLSYDFDQSSGKELLIWNYYNGDADISVRFDDKTILKSKTPSLFKGDSFDLSSQGISAGTKVYVSAKKDGQSSGEAYIIYNPPSEKKREYINQYVEYLGQNLNLYIDSADELEQIVYYMFLSTQRLEKDINGYYSLELYIEPFVIGTSVSETAVRKVLDLVGEFQKSYREAVKSIYRCEALGMNVYKIGIAPKSSNQPNSTTPNAEAFAPPQDERVYSYATSTPREVNFEGFAINNIKKTARVETSTELYFAVEAGFKPDIKNQSIQDMYDEAKSILRRIISDDMTEFQKTNAIFDWICYNVSYDYAVINEMANISPSNSAYDKFYARNSFYMEGVFDDKIAVCNGLAQAFVLMCSIEGIKAVKVNGEAGGAHAWNKVYINNSWYTVDPTWGNLRIGSGGSYKEIIIDDYFLFPYETTSGSSLKNQARTESDEMTKKYLSNNPHLSVEAQKMFVLDGKVYTHKLKSTSDSDASIQAIAKYYAGLIAVNSVAKFSISIDFLSENANDINANIKKFKDYFEALDSNLSVEGFSISAKGIMTDNKSVVEFIITNKIRRLNKPENVKIVDGVLTWEAVPNAQKYVIAEGNNLEVETTSCSYDLSLFGDYQISVFAVPGDTTLFATSEKEVLQRKSELAAFDNRKYYCKTNLLDTDNKFFMKLNIPKGISVNSATAIGLSSADYAIDSATNTVSFEKSYTNQFSSGAVTSFVFLLSNGTKYEQFVQFVSVIPYTISGSDTMGIDIARFEDDYYKIVFDGGIDPSDQIKVSLGYSELPSSLKFWSLSSDKSVLSISRDLFTELGEGEYRFTIHTKKGEIYFSLVVISSEKKVNTVALEMDKTFGRTYIQWKYSGASEGFEVKIGDAVYTTSLNGEMFNLFDGYGFDATTLNLATNAEIKISPIKDKIVDTASGATFIYQRPANFDKIVEYAKKKFVYCGEEYNMYITSLAEFIPLVGFVYMRTDLVEKETATIGGAQGAFPKIEFLSSLLKDQSVFSQYTESSRLSAAINFGENEYPEAIKRTRTDTVMSNSIYVVRFNISSASVATGGTTPTGKLVPENKDLKPQYLKPNQSPRAADYNDFAINTKPYSAGKIATSDELAYTLENMFRPVFDTTSEGVAVETMYNQILSIMRNIISDDMNDFEKVYAIFDWICANVQYDYDAIEEMSGIAPSNPAYNKYYTRNCYYLEGVFTDKIAVCNGLAKAVSVMCAIEGIQSVKIVGTAFQEISAGKFSEGQHAWNKIFLAGSWYLMDTTWGNAAVNIGGTQSEIINHQYLLYSAQSELPNYREEDSAINTMLITSDEAFDSYANNLFVADGKVYDHILTSEEEAAKLANFYKADVLSGKSGLEFKVNNEASINDYIDAIVKVLGKSVKYLTFNDVVSVFV